MTPAPERRRKIAVVYGAPAGIGGLGQQAASVIQALAADAEVHAFGPGHAASWPLSPAMPCVDWHRTPRAVASWRARFTWLRWYAGRMQFLADRALGRWAAYNVRRLKPDLCYVFTQVGLETLAWARNADIPCVVESPNGHIRNFRRVNEAEARRWGHTNFLGHPAPAMVDRIENEYALADRMRVSSQWSRASMIAHGLALPIGAFPQPLNLLRFCPVREASGPGGRLRVCFVGSLDLRKGFVYLLRAIRMLGPDRLTLEIVGATGDRLCKRLLAREAVGLDLHCAPGDPVPAFHRAELFVMPTLEDGSPFAVAEAMACGLPVIVTQCCGAAEWVRPGESGWIVPGANIEALAAALDHALTRRASLRSMGRHARLDTERRAGLHCLEPLREWLLGSDVHADTAAG
jgi:glycosyltransferase involved in cell wall biosynthesis